MMDLSILIPARNEKFLSKTIEDLLEHIEGKTEIIVVLDGQWAEPPIPMNPKVTVVYHPESIGQRAATNEAARLSKAKYLMKVDAHCAFDQGFDVKLMNDIQDDWTIVPTMRNLHVFDWVCPNGHRRYQGPSGVCQECNEPTTMDVVWIPKRSPQSNSYCFDPQPHFQYFGDWNKRPQGQGKLTETMSLQGSCFMMTRDKYFELNVCDEQFGSWGSQGIEVAVKTWLSGGKVIVDHNTWYAHMFRTQGGDFGFPYPLSGNQVSGAKQHAKELFFNNNWDKQIHPLSWLVEKFWPVPGWTDKDLESLKEKDNVLENNLQSITNVISDSNSFIGISDTIPDPNHSYDPPKPLTKGIVYYTENRLDPKIMQACQDQLAFAALDKPIVSVSLQPIDFGTNITLPLERGYLTMFKQILAGLEAIETDVIFLCEHDVLYHPSHFDFVPNRRDTFFYNINVWKMDATSGHGLHYDCKQTSGLCAYRDLLIQHYKERVRRVELEGFSRKMGFEPGTHGRAERVDDYKSISWVSLYPNVDIRHNKNLTPSRWSQEQFRDQRNCQNWIESDEIPGWGRGKELMKTIMEI